MTERHDGVLVDDHGVTLHYHRWGPVDDRPVVQIVHGVGEYAGRYAPLAERLVAAGYTVYASDQRGHGQTGLEQWGGDASRLGRLGPGGLRATVAGVRLVTDMLRAEHPDAPLALIGHSWGSILAQMIIDDGARDYDALVLSGTAYRTPLTMNGGDLARRFRTAGGTGFEWLSRDDAVARAFAADPLTFGGHIVRHFGVPDALRLYGVPSRRVAPGLPVLLQVGGDDPLGGPRSARLLARAYRRRGLGDVTLRIYPGARHEVYNEVNRDQVIDELVAWLEARLR